MSESKTKLNDYIKSLNETLKKGEISLIAGAHGMSKSKLFEGLMMAKGLVHTKKIISDIVTLDSVEMDSFRYSYDGLKLYQRKDPKNKRKAEHKMRPYEKLEDMTKKRLESKSADTSWLMDRLLSKAPKGNPTRITKGERPLIKKNTDERTKLITGSW